jgi:hypothetical protein
MYDNKNYLTSIFDLKNLVKNYFHDYPSLQFRKGNPIDNISNITTPMLMFHGTADDAIQVEQSITFHDACIAAGKSNELIIFPGQPHSYDYPPDPVTFRNRNLFNVLGLISRDSVLAFLQRTVSPYSNKCSNTLTYWKNNITQWSMYSLPMMLGTSSYYNATQLLSLMNAVPGNDMSLRLAQHLITAKLNAMNGANASQVLSAIIEADNLIGTRTLPIVPTIIQGSQEGGQMNSLINTLESFNNGNGNVNCVARIAEPVGDTREEQMVKVFPNPLSNGSAISFSLTQSEKVLLEIYDMNGKLILTVANRIFDLGNHLIELDTDRMNPGIYVLHAKMKEDSSYQELIMNK